MTDALEATIAERAARPARGSLQEQLDTLQRQVDRLRVVEQQMASLGHLGTWEIELSSGRATWPAPIHRLLGAAASESLGLEQVLGLFPAEAAKAMSRALRDLRHGGPGLDLTMPFATAGERTGWLRVLGQVERGPMERGAVGGGTIVGIMRDVTREHDLDQQLSQARQQDPLTGLANRGQLLERLRGTAGQEGSALLLVDIDQLGDVNACYGQASGDQVLVEAARRVQLGLQPGETAYRVGGHTFALTIARDVGPEQALARAQQLQAQVSGPGQLPAATITVAARVGAASHLAHGRQPVDLLHDATAALGQAKAQPFAPVSLFRPAPGREPEQRLGVVTGLRQGLNRVELELFYQPIVDLGTRAARGMEGLIRWRHPTRGLLRPAAFQAGLHDPTLAMEIGEFVLERGLKQMRRWLDAGVPVGCLNLNVSDGQLRRGDLVEQIGEALLKQRIEPWRLRVEVLESTFLEHEPEQISATLARLQKLGVLNALDDFGTGYASLTHLKQLNVNHIKIDRSFIKDICRNPSDAAITRGMIDLARNLGIPMTAEGIEQPQQLTMLLSARCSYGQGYLFARPMPAEEVPGFLARWQAGEADAVFEGAKRP